MSGSSSPKPPDGWREAQLGGLSEKTTVGFVGSMSHLFATEGVPLLRGTNVQTGRLDLRNMRYISAETHHKWSKSALQPGDLVIVRVGYPGRTAIVPCSIGDANAASLVIVRPDQRRLSSSYAIQVLNSPAGRERIEAELVGGAQQVFNTKLAARFRILLPPRAEQERIANVLSDVDELARTLEGQIAKSHAIKQGISQQLLTGRTRLPGFYKPWKSRRLGDLLTYEQPGRYLVSTTDYGTAGTPVLTAGKTFILGYTTEQNGIYSASPVIIFDDFTTASKFVDFPFKAKSSAMKILSARPGESLRYVFERMQLIDFSVVDHKRRWITEYSKMEVDVPDIAEQVEIATVLDGAESEIVALQRRLEKTHSIKLGVMQQLLTGRTRLLADAS